MVKKLSHEQSRRNSARRRRKVEMRHRQAGHWGERSEPMLASGKINYEIGGNVEATPFGGLFAMHRLVTRLGLVKAIDANVELLKIHLPYHESDHVLTLAYSVLCGGTRLEDVDRLRNDVPLMNGLGARLLPDPTTVGDFLRRFTETDIVALMDAVNSVRPALWRGRGVGLLGEVAYLDVDGTIVPTTGQLKQGMDISYKGIWGYAPLLVTLANTREVLYLVNRPGNAPSHLDAAGWIDKAIALVAPYAKRVCVRGDTDFALTAHFDRWAQRVDFVLGTDNIAALRERAEALPETDWQRLHRPAPYANKTGKTRTRRHNRKQEVIEQRGFLNLRLNYEDVAEFTYQPRKCQRAYRVVVLRKNISRTKGRRSPHRRDPLLLLLHHPHRRHPHPGADRRTGQRPLRPGEPHRPAQVRHQRPARPCRGPAQQLGLHAHRRTRLEHQVLARDDDAPQTGPGRLHPHGIQTVPRHRHPHPSHDHRQSLVNNWIRSHAMTNLIDAYGSGGVSG
jgi:hypothetical protein